ncbi:MAG: TIGR03016 family PEP-CTERM system-associated outer membrane protein [Woeseia sp.]
MDITDTNETRAARARGTLAAAIAAACMTTPLLAAEFGADVRAGITHTDNVALATVDEESELVYSLTPSFYLTHEASRLSTNANYQLQAYRYRDIGETEVYHQYNANVRAVLVPEMFFLDVGGNRTQSIRDPEQRIPQSNLPISGNRQDRDQYYAAPSFQYAFGPSVRTQASYRRTWIDYSDSDRIGSVGSFRSQGNEQSDGNFSIDNYAQGQGFSWALRYDHQRTEYDEETVPWEYQQAVAEVGYWVGGNTRLFASGGKESAWDTPLDSSLEDTLWEAGLSQQMGERLSAEIAAGERSFGRSWRGSLDFQFRRGSTSLSYAETPTTEGRNRFRRSALGEDELPDDFLSRPGSAQRFISNRLEWRLNLDFQRTNLTFALFDVDRTDRTQIDGTPLDDESQRGASVTASYRVGARTDLSLRGSRSEREFRDGDKSDLTRASAAVDYRLGARTSLTLQYQHSKEEGESPFFSRNYDANNVSLFVTRTLF